MYIIIYRDNEGNVQLLHRNRAALEDWLASHREVTFLTSMGNYVTYDLNIWPLNGAMVITSDLLNPKAGEVVKVEWTLGDEDKNERCNCPSCEGDH